VRRPETIKHSPGIRLRLAWSTHFELRRLDTRSATCRARLSSRLPNHPGRLASSIACDQGHGSTTRGPLAWMHRAPPDATGGAMPTSEARQYSVVEDGVRMRTQPSTSATILVDDLGLGTIMTGLSDQLTSADGHDWRNVQCSDGQTGWVASELLKLVQ